jgi:subfamily B ATP-binding cassette protein MsbA
MSMIIPFLNILFGITPKVTMQPTLTFSVSSWIENFNYQMSHLIEVYGSSTALFVVCLCVIIVFFLKNLFRWLAIYFLAPIRNGIIFELRNDFYSKIICLPQSYITTERKGDVMSRFANDITEVDNSIICMLESLVKDPIEVIIYLAWMIFNSPSLTAIAFVILPISGFLISLIAKPLKKQGKKGMAQTGYLLSILEETLSGIKIIKAFNGEQFQKTRFRNETHQMFTINNTIIRLRDMSSPLSEFMGITAVSIVLYMGGKLVLSNTSNLSPSSFIAYMLFFSQLINPLKSISNSFFNLQKGFAAVDRINEILFADDKIKNPTSPQKLDLFQSKIEYKNVSFSYKDDFVLKNINTTIHKGKVIALVGPSGSGKSTFADLLPRFWDVTEGEILIDGINIKDTTLFDLRNQMGIVSQEAILFNDTIFNNIAFGINEAKIEDVIAAAKVANAHEFISLLEDGYQTNIGERGGKLSGGQRQRITIARAVLKNPPILILDEATSALDTESEKLVQEALNKLMQNRTTLVIAHRLSTIQHADEILVLQNGVIVENGNHDELLKIENGLYSKLVKMQTF